MEFLRLFWRCSVLAKWCPEELPNRVDFLFANIVHKEGGGKVFERRVVDKSSGEKVGHHVLVYIFLRCPVRDSWTRTMTGFTFLMTYYTYLDCMNVRLSVPEFPLLGFDGFNSELPQKLTWTPKKSPQRKERRLPKHHFGYPLSFSGGLTINPTFFSNFLALENGLIWGKQCLTSP